MNKQRLGSIVFWVGVIYMIVAAGLGGWGQPPLVVRASQILGQATFFLWAFSVPIGLTLAGIGALLYGKTKRFQIVCFGIGMIFVVLLIDMVLRMYLVRTGNHFPWAFGLSGASILILFGALLWFWKQKQKSLNDSEKTVAYLQFIGYSFFLLASWFICGAFGAQFSEGMGTFTPKSPLNIVIYLVSGWFFLFLSHYKSYKLKR